MNKDDGDTVMNTVAEPTHDAAAKQGAVGGFKIKVLLNGVEQGWFTDAGSPEYWITVTPNEADGTTWTQVAYDGNTYFKKSTNNYLSYRSNNVVFSTGMKMRDWATAAKWQLVGKNLKCVDNDSLAGRDGDGFYVNNKNVVEVEFVQV